MTKRNSCGRTLIMTAMAELIYQDQTYIEYGIPLQRLLREIFSSKDNAGLTKKYLEAILQREFDNGGIIMMENGNYALGPRDLTKTNIHDNRVYSYNGKMASSNNSSPELSPIRKKSTGVKKPMHEQFKGEMAIRVGERRKRATKVFDPSENNLPSKRKRGRPMGSLNKTTIKKYTQNVRSKPRNKSDSVESSNEDEAIDHEATNYLPAETSNKKTGGGVCSICRIYRNARDEIDDKLIDCRDCSNKAHQSCLMGGLDGLGPDNTWQCEHCKTCIICIETKDAGQLTLCSICFDAYHALCHVPPIPERSKGSESWECGHCTEGKSNAQNLDTYSEKQPGSDRSSKLSDKSDSMNSSLDKRRDKSFAKNDNCVFDDVSDQSKSKSDKFHSFSPINKNQSKHQYTRKLASPVAQTVYDWKHDDDDSELNTETNDNSEMHNNIKHYINMKSNIITERDSSEPDTIQESESSITDMREKQQDTEKNHFNSIFMTNHDLNKLCTNNMYQKNQNYSTTTNDIDLSIPDAETWTFNDVYQYFLSYFPEQAYIFKDQQIDGQSLLVMRRCDVVNGLGLPLGPALKIYRHVVRLQTRKDDITMCWL